MLTSDSARVAAIRNVARTNGLKHGFKIMLLGLQCRAHVSQTTVCVTYGERLCFSSGGRMTIFNVLKVPALQNHQYYKAGVPKINFHMLSRIADFHDICVCVTFGERSSGGRNNELGAREVSQKALLASPCSIRSTKKCARYGACGC